MDHVASEKYYKLKCFPNIFSLIVTGKNSRPIEKLAHCEGTKGSFFLYNTLFKFSSLVHNNISYILVARYHNT